MCTPTQTSSWQELQKDKLKCTVSDSLDDRNKGSLKPGPTYLKPKLDGLITYPSLNVPNRHISDDYTYVEIRKGEKNGMQVLGSAIPISL